MHEVIRRCTSLLEDDPLSHTRWSEPPAATMFPPELIASEKMDALLGPSLPPLPPDAPPAAVGLSSSLSSSSREEVARWRHPPLEEDERGPC